MNHNFQILYFDILTDYGYADIDGDSNTELFGYTYFVEGEMFSGNFKHAFKRINNKYIYSPECTRRLLENECLELENELNTKPDSIVLERLLSLCTYLNYEDKGLNYIQKYGDILNYGENDKDVFIADISSLFTEKLKYNKTVIDNQ